MPSGPRTARGKAAVRHNSVNHGLRTADIIMPGELRTEWRRFHDEVVDELAPATTIERELASHIAALMWRMRRVPRAEATLVIPRPYEEDPTALAMYRAAKDIHDQFFSVSSDWEAENGPYDPTPPAAAPEPDPPINKDPITGLMTPVHQALDHIVRYEAHLTRELYKAMAYLAALRNARQRDEAIGQAN